MSDLHADPDTLKNRDVEQRPGGGLTGKLRFGHRAYYTGFLSASAIPNS
jgi:hypothetical protein